MTTLHDALLERWAIAEAADPGPWEWESENNDLINPTIIDQEHGEFGTVLSSYPRIIVCGAYVPDDDNAKHIANCDPTTVQLLLDVALAVDRWERGLCEHPDNAEVCGEWRQSNLGRALQLLEAHLCGGEDGA